MTEANFLVLKKDVVYYTSGGSAIKVLSIDVSGGQVKTKRTDTGFIYSMHYSVMPDLYTTPRTVVDRVKDTSSTRSLGKPRGVS